MTVSILFNLEKIVISYKGPAWKRQRTVNQNVPNNFNPHNIADHNNNPIRSRAVNVEDLTGDDTVANSYQTGIPSSPFAQQPSMHKGTFTRIFPPFSHPVVRNSAVQSIRVKYTRHIQFVHE